MDTRIKTTDMRYLQMSVFLDQLFSVDTFASAEMAKSVEKETLELLTLL